MKIWKCADREVDLNDGALVMGILNVTPDSFSDGGAFDRIDAAEKRGLEMIEEGAEIIDIGGESTRPGAEPVSLEEETRRVVPVVERLRAKTDALISIDTTKAELAKRALEAGANIINDVSAFEMDAEMINIAAKSGAGVVLMHMKGAPKTMQNDPSYANVKREVGAYLTDRVSRAVDSGVARSSILIDPGIGFGKTLEHNLALLRGLPELAEIAPVLVGASRKSMIGAILNRENPSERLAGSLGVAAWALLQGARVLRVHDVIETCDVRRVLNTLARR